MGESKKEMREEINNLRKKISDMDVELIDFKMRISILENAVKRLSAKVYEDDN